MLFSKKEEAEAALEMNAKKIKNNHLRVDTAIRQKVCSINIVCKY